MSRELTIIIQMDNAAFADGEAYEVARILHRYANYLEGQVEIPECKPLHDHNGNRCGYATTTDIIE